MLVMRPCLPPNAQPDLLEARREEFAHRYLETRRRADLSEAAASAAVTNPTRASSRTRWFGSAFGVGWDPRA